MALIINNIKVDINLEENVAFDKAKKVLNINNSNIKSMHIYKKSLDARKKGQFFFVYSVLAELNIDEKKLCEKIKNPNVVFKDTTLNYNNYSYGNKKLTSPIVIAGFGPAGIFCAYVLAKNGYNPIVIERGSKIEDRVNAVDNFWSNGILNEECNVQFGEGGAGTFSDGKLTTRISDNRCDYVLNVLHKFGAPEEILTKSKPHIGTDKLRNVIINIRKEIEKLGGTVMFNHRLDDISVQNSKINSIIVNGSPIKTNNLVLAIGHSARDTFSMILNKGALIEPKAFSVGVRIEHLQSKINQSLYGKLADNKNLPQGEYQLSYRENNRGVYTFCMCPGGTVVPSASSYDTVVTNGMSEYKRDKENANSAVVVSVTPNDFGTNPLSGVDFQISLEKKAFELGGKNYKAVGATVGNFLNDKKGLDIKTVNPSYSLGVTDCNFNDLFPSFITDMLKKGLTKFDRKIKGFADSDAVMTGVETRTSSPVRITRKDNFQSALIEGLYPCGEGAGYAGGIMSAAVDGIKIAEEIMKTYAPNK